MPEQPNRPRRDAGPTENSTPDRTYVPVFYVAHPVGGDVNANLARMKRWFAFLVENEPAVAFSVPWLTYVEVLEESIPGNRARGLRDDVAMVRKCDGIVLCGGRISSGMQLELDAAIASGLIVCDLTEEGDQPPDGVLGESPLAIGVARWRQRDELEGTRWKIVATSLAARVRELEARLVDAGLAELRDSKPVVRVDPFDVGGDL